MSITKYCKDCKFLIGVRDRTETAETWVCGHTSNQIGVDVVTGIMIYRYKCREQRDKLDASYCGIDARFWEQYSPMSRPIDTPENVPATKKKPALDLGM